MESECVNCDDLAREKHALLAELMQTIDQRNQLGYEAPSLGGLLDEARRERAGMQHLAQKNRARLDAVEALCARPVDGETRSHIPVAEILAAIRGQGAEPC